MSAARIDRYGGADVFDVGTNADRPHCRWRAADRRDRHGVLPPMTWCCSRCCSIGSPAQIDAAAVPATMGDLGGAVAEIGPNAKELSRRL